MAIQWDNPETAGREIQEAVNRSKRVLEDLDQMVSEYMGPSAGSTRSQDFAPRNTAFEYLSVILPQVVFNNPRARVSTKMQGTQRHVAQALHNGANAWIRDNNLGEYLLDTMAVDCGFAYGVTMMANEQMDEVGEVLMFDAETDNPYYGIPRAPKIYRVSPHDYFEDPFAKSRAEINFQGHAWSVELEELQKSAEGDDTWIAKELDNLTVEMGVQEHRRAAIRGLADVKRGEVVCYSVWDGRSTVDDEHNSTNGYNGVLRTYAGVGGGQGHKSKFFEIREPLPYYGPPDGPYQLFGFYTIPDEAFFLGPLMATRPQQQELNAHETAVMLSDRKYKRTYMVDSLAVGMAKKVQKADHDELIVIKGLSKDAVVPIEVGGSTDSQRQNMLWAMERLDNVLGIDDAQRGNTSGATATEVATVDSAGKTRLSLLQTRFRRSTESLLKKLIWFLYHDSEIAFALGEPEGEQQWVVPGQDGGEAELQEPWFFGGTHGDASPGSFRALNLEIEAYSMPRMSEATALRRVADADAMVASIFPMLPQMPWLKADSWLKWRAEQLDGDSYADWLDMEVLSQVAQVQMGANERATPTLVQGGVPSNQGSGAIPVGRQGGSPAGPGTAAGANTGLMAGATGGGA
jgi:hypothetical protein